MGVVCFVFGLCGARYSPHTQSEGCRWSRSLDPPQLAGGVWLGAENHRKTILHRSAVCFCVARFWVHHAAHNACGFITPHTTLVGLLRRTFVGLSRPVLGGLLRRVVWGLLRRSLGAYRAALFMGLLRRRFWRFVGPQFWGVGAFHA